MKDQLNILFVMKYLNDSYEEQYREIKQEYNKLLENAGKLYLRNKTLGNDLKTKTVWNDIN